MSSDNTFTQANKATQAQLFEEINKEMEAFLSQKTTAPIRQTAYLTL